MTVGTIGVNARDRLEAAVARLHAAGIETPRTDAEWLLADVLGCRRLELSLLVDEALGPSLAARYEAAVARRARREPLQHVLGWEEFRGLRFTVTPDVLVPRPETEILVEHALGALPPAVPGRRPVVVDVGTGSGCIACALARERPDVRVLATDLSAAAAAVALGNCRALGVDGRVTVVVGDLLGAVGAGTADLVVSNPPYLPLSLLPSLAPEVSVHEPRLAVVAGPRGTEVVDRVVEEAARVLRPGGAIALETAGGPQAALVLARLESAGFRGGAIGADLAGVPRLVTARLLPRGREDA